MLIFVGSNVTGRSLPFPYVHRMLELQSEEETNHSLPFQKSLEQVDLQTFDARRPVSTEVPLRTATERELFGAASIQFASAGTINEVSSASE
jgi:hypothetical protein